MQLVGEIFAKKTREAKIKTNIIQFFPDKNVENSGHKKVQWYPAKKIELTRDRTNQVNYMEYDMFSRFELKLVKSAQMLGTLKKLKSRDIMEAECQRSDLVPTKYEGFIFIRGNSTICITE